MSKRGKVHSRASALKECSEFVPRDCPEDFDEVLECLAGVLVDIAEANENDVAQGDGE